VAEQMPTRMLWYQIQPIEAYLQTGNFEKVFELTDSILSGPNKAFSELYLLRGEAYERLGEPQKALREYELALLYNKNLEVAQSKVREMRVKF
jgi:tetratricopeptide (TPR) repeat protein